MPERIPQSTIIRVPLQAYSAADHVTPATGKTIAITLSKNGAAYANPSVGATNATEISNGSYYVDLAVNDTDTKGPLFVKGSVSGVDDIIGIYNVVDAANGGYAGTLTESYAAFHAAPTLAQLLFEMRSILAENNVSGTTVTTKKIDGSTPAETFTINSATAPTAITRAS